MRSYYITGSSQFAGSTAEQHSRLLDTIRRAAEAGVDYIQLREKAITTRALERLATEALDAIHSAGPTKLLINHRTDVALAVGADGVHLTGADLAASDVRALGSTSAAQPDRLLIAVSCHSAEEVRLAESHGADFAVLAPIFEKPGWEHAGLGLEELRRASRASSPADPRVEAGEDRRMIPLFALGGLTLDRAALCAAAGADGVAGIRLFQQAEDLSTLVARLRSL